ncbi:MAG: hypothetical protein ACO2O0_06870 [Desulfurococcales archaeon]|jgi:rRNA-processing protein FCF1
MRFMILAIVDTSAFLLFFEKLFDVIEHLSEDLDEKVICTTTDSVIRELHRHLTEKGRADLAAKYIEKIYEECHIYTLSEDYEKEEADPDIIRLASATEGYILTLDKDLKREAKKHGIKLVVYRDGKRKLETE